MKQPFPLASRLLGACALLVPALACAPYRMSPQTMLPSAASISESTLIVGEITRPTDLVTSTGNPFYAAMQRELPKQLEDARIALKVVSERDLGPEGVSRPAYAIRYRVVEDTVVMNNSGQACVATLTVLGSFTLVPFFFMGQCIVSAEHRMAIEARIFNVETAQIVRVQDATSNEMINVYDTSTLTPLLRREFPVAIEVKRGALTMLNADESLAAAREEAKEAIRQVLAASVDDMVETLR